METTNTENVCCKAPTGGAVSHVNGQFYEGGEFMPVHGKFCGKGRNRIAESELAKFSTPTKRIVWSDEFGRFQLQTLSTFANRETAWTTMTSAASVKTLAVFFK